MTMKLTRTQKGFGIVEVMVAITLSLILILGVSNIFMGSKKSYKLNETSSRVQENGRFSMEFLGRELRQAGYLGCANPKTMKFNAMIDPSAYDSSILDLTSWQGQDAVQGFDNVTSGAVPTAISDLGLTVGTASGNIVAGTDVLILKGAGVCDGGEVVFTGLGNTYRYATTANIKIVDAASCGIDKGSPVMVTDCSNVDLFCVTNNPQSGGVDKDTLAHASNCNVGVKLEGRYGPGSEVFTLRSSVIYVAYNPRGGKSLYWSYLNTNSGGASSGVGLVAEELVEGVVDMQLTYGEDTDNNGVANYYDTAPNVDLKDVNVVRVSILTESLKDNVTQTPQKYTFNGTTVTPSDNKLRRVFTSTIALRNRLK